MAKTRMYLAFDHPVNVARIGMTGSEDVVLTIEDNGVELNLTLSLDAQKRIRDALVPGRASLKQAAHGGARHETEHHSNSDDHNGH